MLLFFHDKYPLNLTEAASTRFCRMPSSGCSAVFRGGLI